MTVIRVQKESSEMLSDHSIDAAETTMSGSAFQILPFGRESAGTRATLESGPRYRGAVPYTSH